MDGVMVGADESLDLTAQVQAVNDSGGVVSCRIIIQTLQYLNTYSRKDKSWSSKIYFVGREIHEFKTQRNTYSLK